MDELKLGYAREDFSPDKPVNMNGSRVGETVYQPIFATALSFSQGDTRALIVGVDLRNVYEHFLNIIKPMITEATGVPVEQIMISGTHMHSGPDMDSQLLSIQRYLPLFSQYIMTVVEEAMADRAPADLYISSIETEGLNFVRRYVRETGDQLVGEYVKMLNDLQ